MAIQRLVRLFFRRRLFVLISLVCVAFNILPAQPAAGVMLEQDQPSEAMAVTSRIYASTDDLEIINQNCSSWSTCRNASTAVLAFPGLGVGTINASYHLNEYGPYSVKRIFQFYDTSVIPADAAITGVALNFHSGQ